MNSFDTNNYENSLLTNLSPLPDLPQVGTDFFLELGEEGEKPFNVDDLFLYPNEGNEGKCFLVNRFHTENVEYPSAEEKEQGTIQDFNRYNQRNEIRSNNHIIADFEKKVKELEKKNKEKDKKLKDLEKKMKEKDKKIAQLKQVTGLKRSVTTAFLQKKKSHIKESSIPDHFKNLAIINKHGDKKVTKRTTAGKSYITYNGKNKDKHFLTFNDEKHGILVKDLREDTTIDRDYSRITKKIHVGEIKNGNGYQKEIPLKFLDTSMNRSLYEYVLNVFFPGIDNYKIIINLKAFRKDKGEKKPDAKTDFVYISSSCIFHGHYFVKTYKVDNEKMRKFLPNQEGNDLKERIECIEMLRNYLKEKKLTEYGKKLFSKLNNEYLAYLEYHCQ